ncbi:hypothetical protein DFH09DRAFT_619929 [Mycena vulgaris]|nr:hypothetical protein DFH09DRAFT_619929 [Mycena vulgaris]
MRAQPIPSSRPQTTTASCTTRTSSPARTPSEPPHRRIARIVSPTTPMTSPACVRSATTASHVARTTRIPSPQLRMRSTGTNSRANCTPFPRPRMRTSSSQWTPTPHVPSLSARAAHPRSRERSSKSSVGEDGEEAGYPLVLVVDAGDVVALDIDADVGSAMAWEQEGHGDRAEYPRVLVASDRDGFAAGYDESGGATAALWDRHGDGGEAEYPLVLIVGEGSVGERGDDEYTDYAQYTDDEIDGAGGFAVWDAEDYASMDADSTLDDIETLQDYGHDE